MEIWLAIKSEIYFLIFCFLIAIFVVQPSLDNSTVGFDDADSKELKERSGFKVYTDFKYGWQYLVTSDGNLIPRLNQNGKHVNIKDEL